MAFFHNFFPYDFFPRFGVSNLYLDYDLLAWRRLISGISLGYLDKIYLVLWVSEDLR